MKRKFILLPIALTTLAPTISMVGCGEKAKPQVVGGNNTLIGQMGASQGKDTSSWKLMQGDEILPATLSIVGPDKDKVDIDDGGYITWGSLTQDSYYFKVQAEYKSTKYLSNDIVLHVGPATTAFVDDGWDVVSWWADAGIDSLHTVYKAECDANIEYEGTLIGLQKKVQLNNNVYDVKVIGEGQDVDENGKKISLTFRFDQLLSKASDGNGLQIFWNTPNNADNHNYWASTLHNALNGTNVAWVNDNSTNKSVIEMFQEDDSSNDGLSTHIKKVSRNINTKINNTWVATQGFEKLFCPVISNIFSYEGLLATDDMMVTDSQAKQYISEGQQYAYYQKENKIGDGPIRKDFVYDYDCLYEEDISHSFNNHWLASPDIGDNGITFFVWEKSVGLNQVVWEQGLAPCFCI